MHSNQLQQKDRRTAHPLPGVTHEELTFSYRAQTTQIYAVRKYSLEGNENISVCLCSLVNLKAWGTEKSEINFNMVSV